MAEQGKGLKAVVGFDDSKLKQGLSGIPGQVQGLVSAIGPMSGELKALLGTAIVAQIVAVGSEFQNAEKIIRGSTGAVGADLAGLKANFENVYGNVGDSTADVALAIGSLHQRLNLTGDELETLSTQFLDLSDVTGGNLKTNIEAVTRAYGDWSISADKYGSSLDYLFRTSQATGVSVDQLAAQLTQFGAPLRQMGFDFETSAAMLGKFNRDGVNTELVMGSLRVALGKFAREGVADVPAALQAVIEKIQAAGSAGEANAIALETFGARAGADMAAAIREGRFAIADLVADLKAGKETISGAAEDAATLGDRFEDVTNQAKLAAEPIAGGLVSALEELLPPLNAAIRGTSEWTKWLDSLEGQAGRMRDTAMTALGPAIMLFDMSRQIKNAKSELGSFGEQWNTVFGDQSIAKNRLAADIQDKVGKATHDATAKLVESTKAYVAHLPKVKAANNESGKRTPILTKEGEATKKVAEATKTLTERLEERYAKRRDQQSEDAAWSAMLRRLEGDQKALNAMLDDYAKVKADAAQKETRTLTEEYATFAEAQLAQQHNFDQLATKNVPDYISSMEDIGSKVPPPLTTAQNAIKGLFDEFETGAKDIMHAGLDDLIHGDISFAALGDTAKRVGADLVHTFFDPFFEAGQNVLKRALQPLQDKLLDIAGNWTGLFGSASGTASTVGGAATGAGGGVGSIIGGSGGGGGAAGGLSGAMGTVNMVTGIVGAAASVANLLFGYGGLFGQAEGDGDVLNKHTLQTANELANLRRDQWEQTEKLYWDAAMPTKNLIEAYLPKIDSSAYWSLAKVSEISQNTYWSLKKLEDLVSRSLGNWTVNVTVNEAAGAQATANAVVNEINRSMRLQGASFA